MDHASFGEVEGEWSVFSEATWLATRVMRSCASLDAAGAAPSGCSETNRTIPRNAHAAEVDRHLRAAQKRRDGRSAGQSPDDPVHRSPAGPAADAAILRRPQGAGPAGRPGLGRRAGLVVDP